MPVQIFDAVNDLNTNPIGYTLVVFVLLLTVGLFLSSKQLLARKRYEMLARGHTAGERNASRSRTLFLWTAFGAVVLISLLPHCEQTFAERGLMWPREQSLTL